MKKSLSFFILPFLFLACKEKKAVPETRFISAVSLIRQQVKHVDSSLYAIVRVTLRDSLPPDTAYIPREKFGEEAREFLDIPDLSDPALARRFKEETRYDSLIRKVVITYTPADPKKEEFKKIEMLVSTELNPDGTNKVSNILAERIISNREGFLQKKLLWKMDRSFLVVTVSQAPGKPEISSTTRVTWNEEELP